MNSRFIKMLQFSLVAMDLFSMNVAIIMCRSVMDYHIPPQFEVQYTHLWVAFNVCWIIATTSTNLYTEEYIKSFESFSRRSAQIFINFLAILMIYLFFYHQLAISRIFITVCVASIGFLLIVNRFFYLVIYQHARKMGYMMKKVLIIGYNPTAKKLAEYLQEEVMNIDIVGFCEEEANVTELSHYPVLGPVADSFTLAEENNVTEIYSTISPEHHPAIYDLMRKADKATIHFRIVPDLSLFVQGAVHIEYLRELPLLTLRKEPLQDPGHRINKRILDIAISFLAIIFVLSWMVPLVGILIYLQSPGPIFFKQERTGRRRQPFICIKFRSMKINPDSHIKMATKGDSRMTRIGRILRKTNLDEFPQFINVLRGEMSLVGPRPHMLKHTDEFSSVVDDYMVRQFLKPGITGWAQIHGYRGEIREVEQLKKRVEYDIWYMENWSSWLDVKIMFLTVWTMVKGDKNAY